MKQLIDAIFSEKRVVVITGAGISTLSGIPDFRGNNGLYTKDDNVEYMLSKSCLIEEPDRFYEFYKKNILVDNIKPNIIHDTLTKLESLGLIDGIITQNIDNLHEKSGSKNVVDLHGNGERFYCKKCNKKVSIEDYKKDYKCLCGGVIRPDIVLYDEFVKSVDHSKSLEMIHNADYLVILGSSLLVNTVGRLIDAFIRKNGYDNNIFIVNNKETPYDYCAKRYEEDLGIVLKKINNEIDKR